MTRGHKHLGRREGRGKPPPSIGRSSNAAYVNVEHGAAPTHHVARGFPALGQAWHRGKGSPSIQLPAGGLGHRSACWLVPSQCLRRDADPRKVSSSRSFLRRALGYPAGGAQHPSAKNLEFLEIQRADACPGWGFLCWAWSWLCSEPRGLSDWGCKTSYGPGLLRLGVMVGRARLGQGSGRPGSTPPCPSLTEAGIVFPCACRCVYYNPPRLFNECGWWSSLPEKGWRAGAHPPNMAGQTRDAACLCCSWHIPLFSPSASSGLALEQRLCLTYILLSGLLAPAEHTNRARYGRAWRHHPSAPLSASLC